MSVVVKGMEMPKCCRECRIIRVDLKCYCGKTVGQKEWKSETRPDWCPLVALPDKHGDLIDKDEFKETLDYYIREARWSDEHNEALAWVKDDFLDAEMTIVEAEGEK